MSTDYKVGDQVIAKSASAGAYVGYDTWVPARVIRVVHEQDADGYWHEVDVIDCYGRRRRFSGNPSIVMGLRRREQGEAGHQDVTIEVHRERTWDSVALDTWRLPVKGGWIYRYRDGTMCFVPRDR